MKADMVLDALIDLQQTIKRLHDPEILTAEVGEYRPARILLHMRDDLTETIQDIGLGLINKDDEIYTEFSLCHMDDINGVRVEWLEMKKAPDAATSETNDGDIDGTNTIAPVESDVKEDSHE